MTTGMFRNFIFQFPSYLTQLYMMFIFLQTGKYLTQNKMSREVEDKIIDSKMVKKGSGINKPHTVPIPLNLTVPVQS